MSRWTGECHCLWAMKTCSLCVWVPKALQEQDVSSSFWNSPNSPRPGVMRPWALVILGGFSEKIALKMLCIYKYYISQKSLDIIMV